MYSKRDLDDEGGLPSLPTHLLLDLSLVVWPTENEKGETFKPITLRHEPNKLTITLPYFFSF
jgi:hypothetical protein